MIKVAVSGYAGRMGSAVVDAVTAADDMVVACGIDPNTKDAAFPVFSKIEDAEIEKQVNRLAEIKAAREAAEKAAAEAAAPKVEPAKEACTFDEFAKMDIRTATVLAAERVPKTDKLLKLTIDTGLDQRTIVSGIAQYYTPEEMVGKQICILANLQPRVIRGIESKGMILMAKQIDGTMRVVNPEERLCNGATVG